MHEIGLVNEAAQRFLESIGDTRVASVEVLIGPGVDPEVARQAWSSAVSGTVAAEARVRWITQPDELTCFACGGTYEGDKLALCPVCGGIGLVTTEAPEVAVGSWSGGVA